MRTLLCCLLLGLAGASVRAADPTYWQDLRPLLRKHCTYCHSTKNLGEVEVSGGLALDTYQAVVKSAGKPGASVLLDRLVTTNEDRRMPQGSDALAPEKIAVFRRWLETGAREGKQPETDITVATPTTPRRKLPVSLPTLATPPSGLLGPGKPGPLQLMLQVGPLAPITAVAFNPDGKLLAAGCYGRVTIWDLQTIQPVKVLTNVLGSVNDVRFSPDGKLLAVGGGQPSARGDLRLYQVSDWKLLGTLAGHQDVVASLAFRPDGKQLASASFDKTVRLWDVATHKLERSLTGHSDFVYAVAYSPDGTWLASASKDRTVKIVETASGKSRFTLSGMDQDVLAVAVQPEGKQVVSSGYESGLYWWNASTGERVNVQRGHGVAVHEICFSQDGKLVASAGGDATVRLWSGGSGAPLRTLATGSLVYAVALRGDGKLVAAGTFDGLVRLYHTGEGRPLLTLLSLPAHGDQSEWLALTPPGYVCGSKGVIEQGEWRMSGNAVPRALVWKALARPDAVLKIAQGTTVPAPTFSK